MTYVMLTTFIFDNKPAANIWGSFEARNRLFGSGRKTETRPKKIKPLTDTGNLFGRKWW